VQDADMIKPYAKPMKKQAGFKSVAQLVESAVMLTRVMLRGITQTLSV